MQPTSTSLLLLLFAMVCPPLCAAAEDVRVHGHRYPRTVETPGGAWTLRGTGTFRYRGLIRVHTAGLYGSEGFDPEKVLAPDQAKRLVLTYCRNVPKSAMVDSANAFLKKNVDAETLRSLRPGIDRLHARYTDVKAGDSYTLSYRPGQGTELLRNNRRVELIEGAEFARAYFSIWLGADPVHSGLRDDLLAAP